MGQSVTFLASLPDILSAVKAGGDGMRVQFDIPETEKANAIPLLALFGVVLRVTIEVVAGPEKQVASGERERTIPARTKRKSTWKAAEEQGIDDASGESAIAES